MTREEAIQILSQRLSAAKYLDYSYIDCVDVEALQMAIEALETPERKKGKWNFCPNCGAEMEKK